MQELIGYAIIGLFYYLVIRAIIKSIKRRKRNKDQIEETRFSTLPTLTIEKLQEKPIENSENDELKREDIDWTQCYQKTHLLTKNEYHEYKKLKYYADQKNLIICPKVRLLDIITPRNGDNQLAALGKISSKHIDFLVCDKDLYIKGIIELDDNSHNLKERKERDKFVDSILNSVGYEILHTRSITEETLDCLIKKKEGI